MGRLCALGRRLATRVSAGSPGKSRVDSNSLHRAARAFGPAKADDVQAGVVPAGKGRGVVQKRQFGGIISRDVVLAGSLGIDPHLDAVRAAGRARAGAMQFQAQGMSFAVLQPIGAGSGLGLGDVAG